MSGHGFYLVQKRGEGRKKESGGIGEIGRSEKLPHCIKVISIQQRHTFPHQRSPNLIPPPDRPVRRLPIPDPNSFTLGSGNLVSQSRHLRAVERRVRV